VTVRTAKPSLYKLPHALNITGIAIDPLSSSPHIKGNLE
jgi:hypothetical protein